MIDDALWTKIERYFPHARYKRKYKQKDVFNACLFIVRTSIQGRNLPEKYPSYNLVFFHFSKWKQAGIWDKLLLQLVNNESNNDGRNDQASRIAMDSQSVKQTSFITKDIGIDGGKKVKGKKRNIAVDSLGLPVAISVTYGHLS